MFKKMWKDEEAVSPVIATILMVAITVVLAGVLVVYMQQFSKTGTSIPTASSSATAFTNPTDGPALKSNGGGWNVKVVSISSTTTQWGTVTVQIMQNGLPYQSMKGVKPTNAKLWNNNGTTKWYAKGDVTPYYCTGSVSPCVSTVLGTATTLTDMMTVYFTYFIVIDTDGSNTMTAGDLVLVYANAAGGTAPTITSSGGYTLEFAIGGAVVCSSPLG
jgi:flagellin-like protein